LLGFEQAKSFHADSPIEVFLMILTHGNTVAPVEAGHLLCFGIGVLLLGIGALLLGGRDPQFLSHPDQLRQRLV
jgi:hypothetical protein